VFASILMKCSVVSSVNCCDALGNAGPSDGSNKRCRAHVVDLEDSDCEDEVLPAKRSRTSPDEAGPSRATRVRIFPILELKMVLLMVQLALFPCVTRRGQPPQGHPGAECLLIT